MITLWSILGNSQRLDGGAMFGNAPRALWARWIEPDATNRVPLACRALLARGVDDGTRDPFPLHGCVALDAESDGWRELWRVEA